MRNILLLLCMAGVISSCYRDKGNYDYTEINQLTLGGRLDSVIKCDQMDLLHIPVEIEGTRYADTSRFTYEWEINQKVVATTKDLNIFANFPLGELTGRYTVTDKELGTKAFKMFKINVSSSTAGDGILVLSKYQGRAELSFKRLDKTEAVFAPNFYYDLVGRYLGTNPKKIHRNYLPEEGNENSGLKIETDGSIKCLSETELVEIDGNTFLDQDFFINRSSVYPPEVLVFNVQTMCHYLKTQSDFMNSALLFVLVNDELWYDQMMKVGTNAVTLTFMQNKSPLGGKLSPTLFFASKKAEGTTGYEQPNLLYFFDETAGRFVYSDVFAVKCYACEGTGEYPGYRLLYATHTSTPNYAMAVLGDGTNYRVLYLNLPSKQADFEKNPARVVADVTVPAVAINEQTVYYPMRNEGYVWFATDGDLYKYNLRSLEAGIAPGNNDIALSLGQFGYDDAARITCMAVSRTEKEIVLGVSRYGDDTEGLGDELKGDVLVLDLKTLDLIKKYEGVSGYPVDIDIKYQKFSLNGEGDELHF